MKPSREKHDASASAAFSIIVSSPWQDFPDQKSSKHPEIHPVDPLDFTPWWIFSGDDQPAIILKNGDDHVSLSKRGNKPVPNLLVKRIFMIVMISQWIRGCPMCEEPPEGLAHIGP